MKMVKAFSCTRPASNAPLGLSFDDDRYDAEKPSESVVRERLARIFQSPIFVQLNRLSRFLSCVVEYVSTGEAGVLKEYDIGADVYDGKPPYDLSKDSIDLSNDSLPTEGARDITEELSHELMRTGDVESKLSVRY